MRRNRDPLSVAKDKLVSDLIAEADVVSVDRETRRALVRLRKSGQSFHINLGDVDPHSVSGSRSRLLVYMSPYGGAYPIGTIQSKPTFSGKPGVTLGDMLGGTSWCLYNSAGQPVFCIDSTGQVIVGSLQYEGTYGTYGTYYTTYMGSYGDIYFHAYRHESGGQDELDGDRIDIDWNPDNYIPSVTPSEANSVDNLTAHLYGIDQALSGVGTDLSGEPFVVISLSSNLTNERVLTAGDGIDLTDGGANGNATLAVDVTDFIDTSYGLTESSNNIRVYLAMTSGLEFSTGALQLADSIAGNGLVISSKILAVGAGDGIDVAADAISVDVTDILGSGLTESSNNIDLDWGTPTVGTIEPDDTASAGTSTNPARSDHQHAIACAVPATIQVQAADEGVATSFTRSDHLHDVSTGTPGADSVNVSASGSGTATSLARSDHTHNLDESIAPTWTGTHTFNTDVQMDCDLDFVGAQSITTTADNLTIAPAADLILDPVGDDVIINASADLNTSNWVSQSTGWGVTYAGAADFREITADEIHVKAFIADIYSALAGALVVTKSRARVSRDFTIPNTSSSATLYVEDLEGLPNTAVFEASDYVCLKVIDTSGGGLVVTDVYGQVTAYSDLSGGEQSWTFTTTTLSYSAGDVIYAGSIVLDYGAAGDGVWQATVLDSAGSPYSEVQTWASVASGEPSGFTTWVRTGNLDGLSGIGTEYGLYAGDGLTSSDSYVLITNSQVDLRNLPLTIHDGTSTRIKLDPTGPYLAVGSSAPTAYLVGDGFWVGNDAGTYKFHLGDVDGEVLSWDGSTLELGVLSAEHIQADGATIAFYDNTTKTAELSGSVWTLGISTAEHIVIDTSGVSMYDSSTMYGRFAATTTLGITTTDHVAISATGIQMKDGSVVRGEWQTDGDIFVGSDISAPGTTYLSIFATAQTYNLENVAAGDMLIGDNSDGKANIYWDASAAEIQFRTGDDRTIAISSTYAGRVEWFNSIGSYVGYVEGNISGGGIFVNAEGVQIVAEDATTNRSVELVASVDGYGSGVAVDAGSVDQVLLFVLNNAELAASQDLVIVSDDLRVGDGLYVGGTISSADNTGDVKATNDGRFGGGLYIGATDTDPAAGTITASDYIVALGGIHVGGTDDPGTDNLDVDGSARMRTGLIVGSTSTWASANQVDVFNTTPALSIRLDGANDDIYALGGLTLGPSALSTVPDAGEIVLRNTDGPKVYLNESGSDGDVLLAGGLTVGSVSTASANGYARIANGLYVGATGTEAGAGTIVAYGSSGAWLQVHGGSDGTNYSGLLLTSDEATDREWAIVHKVSSNTLDISHDNSGWTTVARITPGGIVFVGDESANSFMTKGVTINQAGSDDEVIACKSSDISHAMTNQAEADTFCTMRKLAATGGGVRIDAYGTNPYAISLRGNATGTNTAKSTSALGAILIQGQKDDGSYGVTNLGTDGNILVIRDLSTARFVFDGGGNFWYYGGLQSYKNSTTYDVHAMRYLSQPLTSTSWDGDGKTNTDDGTIDLSSVFGAPAGIKAALLMVHVYEDKTGDGNIVIGPTSSYGSAMKVFSYGGNSGSNTGAVPCDSNGDIYVDITTGDSLHVIIEIWGYAL